LDQDVRDLAEFGYRQRLNRTLGSFSAFAAGFSYLSVLTGSSQLFHIGYSAGGPAFFWTWPAVFLGQFLVALCFAELAARFPLSGGVYQWSKLVGSEPVGWMSGWVYLACSVITLASTALALQTTLPQLAPVFQLVGNPAAKADAARNAVWLGSGLIAITTLINVVGVRVLARINNVGVLVEMLGTVLLIGLLAAVARRGPAVVLDAQGRGAGEALGYLGPALAASLMATFVLYGFDTAGTLAEETEEPRRRAPRAILLALGSVGVVGSLLVFTAIRAAPDLRDPALSHVGGGLPHVVKLALGSALGSPFLLVVVFAIFVCTLTVHAAAVRLMFALARDNHLPFSRLLARVNTGSRTPTVPAVVIGLAASGLLVVNLDFPQVIEVLASLAVVWANLAYLFVTVPLLRLRRSGWPAGDDLDESDDGPEPAIFGLGQLGVLVNLAAVAWGVLVVFNIGWPRAAIYGEGWLGRFGAAPATLGMVAAGWLYYRLFRRHRSGILDEHRA
jgi:urea carboxylase system permease